VEQHQSTILQDYFTKKQFAEEIDRSERTVDRLFEAGLPFVMLGPQRLIPKNGARDWLARGGTAAPVRRTRRPRAA
jgi:hypothetical protein